MVLTQNHNSRIQRVFHFQTHQYMQLINIQLVLQFGYPWVGSWIPLLMVVIDTKQQSPICTLDQHSFEHKKSLLLSTCREERLYNIISVTDAVFVTFKRSPTFNAGTPPESDSSGNSHATFWPKYTWKWTRRGENHHIHTYLSIYIT